MQPCLRIWLLQSQQMASNYKCFVYFALGVFHSHLSPLLHLLLTHVSHRNELVFQKDSEEWGGKNLTSCTARNSSSALATADASPTATLF